MQKGMKLGNKRIQIGPSFQTIHGSDDDQYFQSINGQFEPMLTNIFALLCENGDNVIDVGANYGLTAIAIGNLSPAGKVLALEPVTKTCDFCLQNVEESKLKNISVLNVAATAEKSTLTMCVPDHFSAGSFAADIYKVESKNHPTIEVPGVPLDDLFEQSGLSKVNFIKIDTEGFEIEVLKGAKNILQIHKPIVFMEMNHWALNVFRNTALPAFVEFVLETFPNVFAIDDDQYIDLSNNSNRHFVFHEHIVNNRFDNLICGFDRSQLLSKLSYIDRHLQLRGERDALRSEQEKQHSEIDELKSSNDSLQLEIEKIHKKLMIVSKERDEIFQERNVLINSNSWKITKPLRCLRERGAIYQKQLLGDPKP